MFEILVKIPKEYYNDDTEYNVKDIMLDAIPIMPRIGEISVSNNDWEIVGYISVNPKPDTTELQTKYENIIITNTEFDS